MFGMNIKTAKANFFDRQKVTSAVDRTTLRVLSKFGAFVRKTARQSIRKRKASSPPGSPPSSHTGLLKKFIFFSYDPTARSVVIGPTALNRKSSAAGGSTVPQVLEYAGETFVESRTAGRRVKRKVPIAARPYMGPAFEAERPKVAQMWKDAVR